MTTLSKDRPGRGSNTQKKVQTLNLVCPFQRQMLGDVVQTMLVSMETKALRKGPY